MGDAGRATVYGEIRAEYLEVGAEFMLLSQT